ncbi:MAG: hypothetical protein V4696_05590 [Pseudomonadota bacterium]
MAMETGMTKNGGQGWRIAGWGAAVALLAVPFVAMRFTDEVKWTASDFLFAGILFGTVGLVIELAVRKSTDWAYRGGVAFAAFAGLLIIWANGAVGMIGNEDNGYNLLFGLPILIALLGSVAVRFRALGMSMAMLAAAAVHIAVALGGLAQDSRGVVFSLLLSSFWIAAAAFLRGARRDA